MIGRCDRGHVHIAATGDIPNLRALEDVTPPREITKVSSRCFLSAQAIDQELTNCPMVFKIRFECPSESTTVDDDVRKPLLGSIKKSCDNIVKPHDDTDGDVVQDAIARLETKIGKFEKNMTDGSTKDIMKFFVQFKNTILHHLDEKDSLIDALTGRLDQLENRMVEADERVLQLETKLEKFQKDTMIEKYIEGSEIAIDGTTENHLQVREDSLIEALNEKVSQLQNQIADMGVSDKRKIEALQIEADTSRTEINAFSTKMITLQECISQWKIEMKEAMTNSSHTDALKKLQDEVKQVDTQFSKYVVKNDSILNAIEIHLDVVDFTFVIAKCALAHKLATLKEAILGRGRSSHRASVDISVEAAFKERVLRLKKEMKNYGLKLDGLNGLKDICSLNTSNYAKKNAALDKLLSRLDMKIKTLGKEQASASQSTKN